MNNSIEDVKFKLRSIETACEDISLQLNAKKTQSSCYKVDASRVLSTMFGERLEVVKDYKFLGSLVDSQAAEIKIRVFFLAWAAQSKLKTFRKPDKCKLFAATVESVLAYGTETWRMSKTLEAFIDRNKVLRSAFNITWHEFVTNERSFELAQCEKLTVKVRSKRIQYAGRCFK